MIFVYFKLNNTLNKRDNLALRANFVTWYFCFPRRGMLHETLVFSKTLLSQNANFLITDEQELI